MTSLSKLLSMLLLIAMILFGKSLIMDKAVYQGEIAMPIQVDIKEKDRIILEGSEGKVELIPRAEYSLTGVVKSKKKYSDYTSQISEYDLAMAWGDLNKDEIDSGISYSQNGRWYYYKYSPDISVNADYISKNSANVHIIHKDKDILKKIESLKEEDYIKLEGYLVDVDFKNPNNTSLWETSETRNDTGNGACEIMYVENVTIIE
ncbi:MAG: hypothetical protein RBR71_09240 [Gudongella sp.]|nr:hypothetical protein [Gudongella sp.]